MRAFTPGGGLRKRWFYYAFLYKNGRRGMIPGSVHAVRYKKKYMLNIAAKKMMSNAGADSMLSLATNIQKGMRMINV